MLRRRLATAGVAATVIGVMIAAILGVIALAEKQEKQRQAQELLARVSHLVDAERFVLQGAAHGVPLRPADAEFTVALSGRLATETAALTRIAPVGRDIESASADLSAAVMHELDLIKQHRLDEAVRFDDSVVQAAYERLGSDAPSDPRGSSSASLLVPAAATLAHAADQAEFRVYVAMVLVMGGAAVLAIGLLLAYSASLRRKSSSSAEHAAQLAAAGRLQALVRNSSDLTLVCDVDGTLRYVSPASLAILGVPDDELTGTPLSDLLHPVDREPVLNRLRELSTDEDAGHSLHCRIRRDDGSYLLMEASFTNLLEDPAVAGIVANLHDVTERSRLEAELRHTQKLESVGQLASGIAHEINTPIQFIGDNVRFIGDAFDDVLKATVPSSQVDIDFLSAEVPQAIAQTLEGVERVAAIVRAMKAFGHPGNEDKSPTDLNGAVRNTLVVASNTVKHVADVAVELGDLPPVWCHAGDINQVLVNLVINAAHAIADKVGTSSRRGVITIRTFVDGEDAVLQVADTGTGIPKDIAGRVFEPFFTTKEVGRGTGQGLALAYTLVTDRHAGSISFVSEDAVGTTFTVRLPVDGKRAQPSTSGARPPSVVEPPHHALVGSASLPSNGNGSGLATAETDADWALDNDARTLHIDSATTSRPHGGQPGNEHGKVRVGK
ncbi:MAG TPA: ATP-binding protein [Jatrophihabitantaceae bacterium]|nr:ATP-binding protein [Jatrophihabitantaceae bacterium]